MAAPHFQWKSPFFGIGQGPADGLADVRFAHGAGHAVNGYGVIQHAGSSGRFLRGLSVPAARKYYSAKPGKK